MKTTSSGFICGIAKKKWHVDGETKDKGAHDFSESYEWERFFVIWSSLERDKTFISFVVNTDSPDRLKTIKSHKCYNYVRCA